MSMCDGKVPPPRWGRFQNIVFTKDGHVVDIFWRFTGETIHLTISNPQPCFIPREEARFRVRTDEWRPGEFSVRLTQIGDDPS